MKRLFVLSLIAIVLFDASSLQAQTSQKFDLWKKHSYFRGFDISLGPPLKDSIDFADYATIGATFASLACEGFRSNVAPYSESSYNIQVTDNYVAFCHAINMQYVLAIRQGPGRSDVWDEGAGTQPKSTIWTNPNEQQLYASMLREIAARYKDDSLFVGITPIMEPNPFYDSLYFDTASLNKFFLRNNVDFRKIMQTCVDSIRSVSADIPILIQGPAFAAPEFIPLAPVIHDPFIIYEYHCYRPREYVYACDTCTTAYPGNFISYIEKKISVWHDKKYLKDSVLKFVNSREKETGAPILMGEFGVEFPHTGGDQLLGDLSSIAIENGWHFAYWNFHGPGSVWNYDQMPAPYWTAVLKSFEGNSTVGQKNISGDSISISPNPCSISTTISIAGENAQRKLSLFDILGNKRKEILLRNSTTEILTDDLTSGEYLVVMQNGEQVMMKRLVVAK